MKSMPNERYIYPPLLQCTRDLHHPLPPTAAKVWAAVRNNRFVFSIHLSR